jgi:hypothetical protein
MVVVWVGALGQLAAGGVTTDGGLGLSGDAGAPLPGATAVVTG